MTAADAHPNTPALAWAWLRHRLAELDEASGRSIGREWRRFRSERDGRSTNMASIIDWPPDFWIAKTQHVNMGILMGIWSVPEGIDQWPGLEMRDRRGEAIPGGRATNSAALTDLLTATDPAAGLAGTDGPRRFLELLASTTAHEGPAAISANQARTWVTTALGGLLGAAAFTPVEDAESFDAVVRSIVGRIADVDSLPRARLKPGFADFGCHALYNSFMTEQGMRTQVARQGQGTAWRDHWQWLSTAQDAQAMNGTLQLTGLLLVNEPLLAGLTAAVQFGDDNVQKRALCVARRWMLTTKALAWLVEALRHPWSEVRPQDLACFAFGALSPAWPRRAVAVSHRSAEVKPVLREMSMWRSPHAAVDASYVPAWETNTGMIWSLFAPVPLVARVSSPRYVASEWCRREYEMLQYLVDHADFLDGRTVVDVEMHKLSELDTTLFAAPPAPLPAPQGEFPPLTLALVGDVPVGLEQALLRAGCALRMINLLVRDPAWANELAARAAAGVAMDLEVPTNNPDGWTGYGRIFRELQDLLPERTAGTPRLSLWMPDDYPDNAVQRDLAAAHQIPDMSTGQPRLADVLGALEWRTSLFGWFRDEDVYGDTVLVDVSAVSLEEWATGARTSVARGLVGLNGDTPTWIMQRAGQNAHEWPGFHDNPLFTRHSDDQFTWLKPVFADARWLIYYTANSGLGIASDLQAAMIERVVRAVGREAIQTEEHPDGVQLVVPLPNEIFAIPVDALRDMADVLGDLTNPPT